MKKLTIYTLIFGLFSSYNTSIFCAQQMGAAPGDTPEGPLVSNAPPANQNIPASHSEVKKADEQHMEDVDLKPNIKDSDMTKPSTFSMPALEQFKNFDPDGNDIPTEKITEELVRTFGEQLNQHIEDTSKTKETMKNQFTKTQDELTKMTEMVMNGEQQDLTKMLQSLVAISKTSSAILGSHLKDNEAINTHFNKHIAGNIREIEQNHQRTIEGINKKFETCKTIAEAQMDTMFKRKEEALDKRKKEFAQQEEQAYKTLEYKKRKKEDELNSLIAKKSQELAVQRESYEIELEHAKEKSENELQAKIAEDKRAFEKKVKDDQQKLKNKEEEEMLPIKKEERLAVLEANKEWDAKVFDYFNEAMKLYKEDLKNAREVCQKNALKYKITKEAPEIKVDEKGKKYVKKGSVSYKIIKRKKKWFGV